MTQMQQDDFDIEYGVSFEETTDTSEYGFRDKHGDYWETRPSKNDGAVFYARRQRDGYTIEVMSVHVCQQPETVSGCWQTWTGTHYPTLDSVPWQARGSAVLVPCDGTGAAHE